MSLQTRLQALATAVGSDIKQLFAKRQSTVILWTTGLMFSYRPGLALGYLAVGVPGYTALVNFSNQNGDWASWQEDISPGTWNMRVFYATQSNLGIVKVDYSLDNGVTWTTAVSNLDLYSAATVGNLYFDVPSIVIAYPNTKIIVRWTVVGTNPSSGAYYMFPGPAVLTRSMSAPINPVPPVGDLITDTLVDTF